MSSSAGSSALVHIINPSIVDTTDMRNNANSACLPNNDITMNVTASLSRRPLGCLKAGLCQSLIRGYATAVAASTTQSTGALPDHNFCTASRHPPTIHVIRSSAYND